MLSLISQLFKFMRVYRKFWMAPIILGLLCLGGAKHRDRTLYLRNLLSSGTGL